MDDNQQSDKERIYNLVSSQKKAKLIWVSTVTEIPIEKLAIIAEEMGLVIEDDFIFLPKEEESLPIATRKEYSYTKPQKIVRLNQTTRIVFIIIAIFFILALIPALLFGVFLIGCASGEIWAIITGIAIIIIGIGSCALGFIIIINQR